MGEPARCTNAEASPASPQGLTRDGRNLAAEVKANPEYKKLVDKCAARWNKPYKRLPINKQDTTMKSDEDFQQVIASSARKMGGALGEFLLIHPDKKAKAEASWEQRTLTNLKKFDKASYEACRVRCDDMDFVELNLRVQYGDAEFERLFPNRYINHEESTSEGTANHKRTQYCIRRRTIENRWNLSNKRARMPLLYIEDWTDGEEDDKTLSLLEFINYLVKTEYLEGVLTQFNKLGASVCRGEKCAGKNCAPSQCSCRESTGNSGGNMLAYGPDAEADLKFECISECECDEATCENRKVQRGRQILLCVFREPGKDWGVRTICEIGPKTFVTEYCGEASETGKIGDKARYDFSMRHPMRQCDVKENLMDEFVVSAAEKGNESRYFNHSCDPNMESCCVVIERYGVFFHHIAFFTGNEGIPAGAELTFDYFPDKLRGDRSTKHMFHPCKCGTAKCRFLKRAKANGISSIDSDRLMEDRLRNMPKRPQSLSRMATLFGFMSVREIASEAGGDEGRVMPRIFRRDFTSSAEDDVSEEEESEEESDDEWVGPALKSAPYRKFPDTKYCKGGIWKENDPRAVAYNRTSTGGKAPRKVRPPSSSEEESEDYSSDEQHVVYGVKYPLLPQAMRKSAPIPHSTGGGKAPRRVPPTGIVAQSPVKQMATKQVLATKTPAKTVPIFPKHFTEASGGIKRVARKGAAGTYEDYSDDETETDEETTDVSEDDFRQYACKAARKTVPMLASKAARKSVPMQLATKAARKSAK